MLFRSPQSGKSQGNSKFYLKVSEKSGNFIFVKLQGLQKSFLVSKGNVFSKNICEGLLISVVLSPKDLSWMFSGNFFVLSEKLGNFFYLDEWQPGL